MTHPNRARLSKLSLALIAALAAAPVLAQSTSAAVGGRVLGANGQPVAGAEVVITHVESGTSSRVVTDAQGRYNARGLRVGGPYTISVNTASAGSDTEQNVYLGLSEANSVNLDLAQTLESVTVVGGYSVFDPQNKGLGTVVSQRQLETTPQGNRSIDDVARLDPRVQVTDQGDGSISAAGLPNRYNNIAVDGMSQGDPFGLNANGMPYQGTPISIDTIAEYNISTVNFDVSSDTIGADINAVTKSGTNDFHGSAYYAFRNADNMVGNAGWREGAAANYTAYDRNWTGGLTLGGPILKDRLFFFLSAEQETTTGIGADSTNGLDPSLGDGPSTANKLSPGDLQRVIDTATALGLKPGSFSGGDTDLKDRRYLAKLDWNINDDQRASFTYQRTEETQPIVQGNTSSRVGLSSYWYTKESLTENASLQLFSNWSDSFSTEAKVSYQSFHQDAGNPVDQPQVLVYVDRDNSNAAVNLGKDQYRHYNVIDTKKWSGYFAGTWYLGDHAIKGGVAYERNDIYNLFGRTQFGNYTFNSIDDFANGDYDSFFLYQPGAGMTINDVAAQWVYSQISPFLQDTWQVNDRLSVQYGLRVNIPHADHKPIYNAAFAQAYGYPNSLSLDSGKKLVEPRASFNYDFATERRTQLRGGIGLFQTTPPTVWMTNPYQNNGLTVLSYSSFDPASTPFSPDPYNQNLPPSGGTGGPVDTLSPDFHLPSVWKFALALDHELPWWGLVGSVEYQYLVPHDAIYYQAINLGAPTTNPDGSVAYLPDGRLQFWRNAGQRPRSSDANYYRNYGFDRQSTRLGNTNNGHASSLTLAVTKPFSDSWFGNVSLNFADSTEVNPANSSQAFSGYQYMVRTNPNDEIARTSDRNIDKSIKASLTWQHAFFGDYKTSVSAFYTGRTGLPYSWIFSGDMNGDGVSYQDPMYIPYVNDPIVSYGSASPQVIQEFHNYINSDSYLRMHRGEIAERNAARSPWINQLDLGLQQELPGLFKEHKAVVRLDVYNFLNMLNSDWGVTRNTGFNTRTLAGYNGLDSQGRMSYFLPTVNGHYQPQQLQPYDAGSNPTRVVSRWSVLATFRYEF